MAPADPRPVPSITPRTRVGWVGCGVMGAPMCAHVMKKGFPVILHTRTKEKAMRLLEKGAKWADSPKAVAEHSDVAFTMLGFPQDVRRVYLSDNGLLAGARPGSVLVDMTSTEPKLAQEIALVAKARGLHSVDAPVSGGDVGALNGRLSIMAGGDQKVVKALMPLFEAMGNQIVYQGGPGAGQHAKLCNQIAIAGTMIGVCESLLYGYKAGLDLKTMVRSIATGAAACWTLDNLAPRILKRHFEPGFFVEHFIKDMGIALEEAKRMGLVLPGLALAHQLYLSVRAHGHGKSGTQALLLALEAMSNTEVKTKH